MKIAIWTKSPPKLAAIENAITECIYFKWESIELISKDVDSWISDMPITIQESMLWAKNRAINISKITEADFYIWMEWWTSRIWRKAYLFWIVYILNNKWEWHYWISNMMEVPKIFDKRIYENWEELWPILSEVVWEKDAHKKGWAFWHWSDDMITRKDQFILAFLSAIPAFYNKYYKL